MSDTESYHDETDTDSYQDDTDSDNSFEEPVEKRPKPENGLTRPLVVSPALSEFLGLQPGEKISRAEVNCAIIMYIFISDVSKIPTEKKKWLKMNPGGQRNLRSQQDLSVIIPDEKLSTLLNYPAYVDSVLKGEKKWLRQNKNTGQMEGVSETDPKLTYAVVQHLLCPHFLKT